MKNSKWNFRILFAHCITIVLWGSAFPGIRVGLEAYTPEHLTLLRLLIASFALFILAIISKMRLPELKDIPVIFILGGLGFTVYHIALNYGEQSVSAGPASLIVSVTTPIFTAILACIFFREKFKLWGWIDWHTTYTACCIFRKSILCLSKTIPQKVWKLTVYCIYDMGRDFIHANLFTRARL